MRRYLVSLALGLCGCVDPFNGSWLALSLVWPLQMPVMGLPNQPVLLPPSEHLEIWARMSDGHYERLTTGATRFPGFDVQLALDPNDPCMIRYFNPDDPCRSGEGEAACGAQQVGAHLLSADAQAASSAGERSLQQLAVVQHAREVVSVATAITAAGGARGKAPVPLLVLVEHDPDGKSGVPGLTLANDTAGNGAEAQNRYDKCRAFIGDPARTDVPQAHPNYYIGNPRQLTKPLHGRLFGFFNFCTTPEWPQNQPQPTTCAVVPDLPSQNFGSITLTTPTALSELTGLLVTRETEAQPTQPSAAAERQIIRGVQLPASAGGRGAIRLALTVTVPTGMGMTQTITVGTASVLTGLEQELE